MAVPKKKSTRKRKYDRRSHHSLSEKELKVCLHCGSKTVPHTVCSSCGYYKDKDYLGIEAKQAKKDKKKKDREKAERSK